MGGELPGPLCLPSAFPFVGRVRELEALRALLPSARSAAFRVAVVGGEAGSGKSRLVRELAREAAAGDARVLYGACDAIVRAPYGPIAEALEPLALPLPGDPAPDVDPDTARHRLHTELTSSLEAIARERPLLLVVEDLHWADTPTLALLRHLARTGGRAPLLLLATFREGDTPDALSETLVELRRSDDVVRVPLKGLTRDEVAAFVRNAAGGDVDPELVTAITDVTAGNAFLVSELWRSLQDAGAVERVGGMLRSTRPLQELATPESVREVSRQRLARLTAATAGVLELAAVAGDGFGLAVARATGLSQRELLGALDEAEHSGFLAELPSRPLAYRFTHELVRRAVYDGLSAVRRAELHLQVGEALEAADTRPDRLAHHFTAAAPLGGGPRAVQYSVVAARDAAQALAFDEAAEWLRAALALGVTDPEQRAELLLDLGVVQHKAGRADEALRAFGAAAADTRSPGRLARAAIGYEEACWRPIITDALCVELLDRAAAALGPVPTALLVGVYGGLARTLLLRGEHERGGAVRAQALAMARGLDDPIPLAKVLVASHWAQRTIPPGEVLAALSEAASIAERAGYADLRSEAMSWHTSMLMTVGDVAGAREESAAVRVIAERTAQPFQLHVAAHTSSAIALCEGRLADAEALAQRAHAWSRLLTGRDASGVHGIQMFSVRREQDRLAELAPVMRLLASGSETHWRPGLAALLVELGMLDEARALLAQVTADGLHAFQASLWVASLTYLTDACSAVGDTTLARALYAELQPLAGGNVVVGHVVACYGAADRYLGMLAAVLSRHDAAAAHFEAALALNRRMGADTWVAHTAYEHGRLLGGERGAALLAEAAQLARRIGLVALQRRIGTDGSPSTPPDGLSFREVQILALVAEGLSNREIGGHLTISEHTAANHIRSILRKTGCANRTEATTYAHRHGLVETTGRE